MQEASDLQPPSDTSNLKLWLAAAAVALAVLAYVVFTGSEIDDGYGHGRSHPAVGHRPATLHLEPLGGGEAGPPVDFSTLAGKVVVLNFWAVWCPPCREELPLLADYAHRMRDNPKLAILPVVYDQYPDDSFDWLEAAAPKVYKQLSVSITSYFDPEAATQRAVMAEVGQSVFPTTVVLDQQGTIRGVWTGFSPRDFLRMQRLVDELLTKKTDPPKKAAAGEP